MKAMVDERVAVQQTLNRYTIGACRADWDAVLSTFVENGIWETPSLGISSQGRAAIRASLCVYVDQMDYFVQINAPGVIEVDGNRATACSALREYGRFSASGEAVEVFGLYDDLLVRTAAGWQFERRTFTLLGMNGTVPADPAC